MLYNPSWKKDRTRGLNDLINWLMTKDPTEKYKYTDASTCAACQYNASLGLPYEVPRYVFHFNNFDRQLETIARGEYDYTDNRHTYGRMLLRALSMKNSLFQRWIG